MHLYADRNVREHPHVALGSLDRFDPLLNSIFSRKELLLGEPCAVALDADSVISKGKRRALGRASGGHREATLLPFGPFNFAWREHGPEAGKGEPEAWACKTEG